MRVWFLNTDLWSRGGAERVLYHTIVGLPRNQFAVRLVTLYGEGDLFCAVHKRGLPATCLHGRGRADVRAPLRLLRQARHERPEVMLTTGNLISFFWGTVLRQFGLVRRLVVAFHTTRFLSGRTRPTLHWRKSWVDQFVALAPTQMHFWQKQLSIPSDRFTVIPNGIDTTRFVPVEDKRALRRTLQLPEDAVIVSNIAFFKPVKNLPLFVEVAADIHRRTPNTHFVLVGEGDERPRIEEAIRRLGLTQAFTLPGRQSNPVGWYQASDVLLMTSLSEAFPLTIVEAAACGAPAVSTAVGGVPDIIRDGETGFLAPPEDKATLTQRLLQLCTDESLRVRMGFQARQRVLREFSQERMLQGYAQLFWDLAQRPMEMLLGSSSTRSEG